jgi:hypothetical protein
MALLAQASAKARRVSAWQAAAFALLLSASPAYAGPPLEDAVKAAYIYKFAPFVTWPPATPDAAFGICVDGIDKISALLPQATAGQQIDGHRIVVRAVSASALPPDCRILYIADASDGVLDAVRTRPVLTVTNDTGGAHGIVNLRMVEQHVRFDIDMALAEQAGLSISSKLLSLAHAITPAAKGASR